MKPSTGARASSAALIETVSVALPFGATVSNMPVLTAGVKGLKVAVPSMVSLVGPVRLKLFAQYVKGLVPDRQGCPVSQSWLKSTGRVIVLLSIGASAR